MSRHPPQRFLRDPALPFLEARSTSDGRGLCYEKHAHDTFSIGAVTGGVSLYLNGTTRRTVRAGTVIVVNPDEVHACNPVKGEPWSYRMLHVDVPWLTRLQHDLGFSKALDFRAFSTAASTDPELYRGCNRLFEILADPGAEAIGKQTAAIGFFSELHRRLNPAPAPAAADDGKLSRAAEFIRDNFTDPLRLEDICAQAELSPSYLIRAFRRRYGMTPHAFLVNRRVQYGRAQLRRGRAIADVALEAGFADQAHFQRAFKRLVAATPGQYRS